MPAEIDRELREDLKEDDPQLLSALDKKRNSALNLMWPEPTEGDIQTFRGRMESVWSGFHQQVNEGREQRYQRDVLAEKWARQMEGDTRIRSRLSHNEILRVVADQLHNAVRIDVPPASDYEKDKDRATKRKRWANALMPYLERRTAKPLRARFKDAQLGDGLAAYEVYMTKAYDDIDFEAQDVDDLHDAEDINPKQRKERPGEINKRTEKEMRAAGLPFGIRTIDPLAMYYDEDDDGLRHVAIIELKNQQQVFSYLVDRLGPEEATKKATPSPGIPGVPNAQWGAMGNAPSINGPGHFGRGPWTELTESVECIRYYDRRWYVYIVAGEIVEGPIEHGMDEVPVFPAPGIITSSPQKTESFEGVTYGMMQLEKAVNDLLTLTVDTAFTYNRPHPVIETDVKGQVVVDPQTKMAAVLDLADPRKVRQLGPGQHIVDAFQGFVPNIPQDAMNFLVQLFERSGRNPLLSGQSPGSDASGYTVNSLMASANTLYEQPLDNEALAVGRMFDFIFRFIKNVIGERVYIPAKGSGKGAATEWMAIGPDDIDDTPVVATVDPLSDANRVALRQSLVQGWKDGLISRRMVQEQGYAIEDTEAMDNEIIEELAQEEIAKDIIAMARQILQMQAMTPDAAATGGTETVPGVDGPPPTPPPTVGAAANAASQGMNETRPGERALETSTGNAGQASSPSKVNQI